MRVKLIDSPQHIANTGDGGWLTLRVKTGTVWIARDNASLLAGLGLNIETTDNIVSIVWRGDLWARATTAAEVEIILP